MRQEELWDVEAAESYDTPGTGAFAPELVGYLSAHAGAAAAKVGVP
jgi:hypothetical protein